MVTSRIWFTANAEGRAVGMEERAKCCGHLAGAGSKAESSRSNAPNHAESGPGPRISELIPALSPLFAATTVLINSRYSFD
jgi:hypothetical protein